MGAHALHIPMYSDLSKDKQTHYPSDPFARQCAYCGQQDFTHRGCNRCGAAEFRYEKKHKKEKNNEI